MRVADFDRKRGCVVDAPPTTRSVAVNDIAKKALRRGDLLLEKSGGGATQPVGFPALWMGTSPAVCSNFVARLRPTNDVDSSFVHYILLSAYQAGTNRKHIKQTTGIQNLDVSAFLGEAVAVPPRPKQRAIADFLDRKTAAIDGLIEKKERLIELLQEKRQALITQAVTKGLDPTVPMKDSGVEWIGMTPRHWKVLAIRRLSLVKRGASPRPIDDPVYFDPDGEYGWTRISDVTRARGRLQETKERLSTLGSSRSVKLEPESLILSIAASVGVPCILGMKACVHDGFVYFPELRERAPYLYQVLSTGRCFLGLGKLGTQLNLNTDTVASVQVPVPPATEAALIAQRCMQLRATSDELVSKVDASVRLLREYRQALITNAVTGQLDIPGVA